MVRFLLFCDTIVFRLWFFCVFRLFETGMERYENDNDLVFC